MKVGLIDVDGHHFPNIPLMKISAWHKRRGDVVEWYNPLIAWIDLPDMVYMSKVFTFTGDYPHPINAKQVVRGGTGYDYPTGGKALPEEIEHIYPDYSLYPELCKDTAYGFLTRGCPRNCGFCIVSKKEGFCSYKAADLEEFWHGQKKIKLLDPNILACQDWQELFEQLIESRAWIDFTQGCDIRLMTPDKAEMIRKMRIRQIHFAWDSYEDAKTVVPKLEMFQTLTGWDYRKMTVYVLTGYDTTLEQDLERIYTLRDMGYTPYVMIYNNQRNKTLKKLQRWVNSKYAFYSVPRFEDYKNT